MVAGKLEHQTPVLSRHIEFIEFNPYWNVPPSIMVKEILPMLRQDPETLHKHQLQVYWQGQPMESQSMDWTRVDPGKISMKQPPGQGNVLGTVKFGFPNRHDVYMHDTPTKQLFNNTVRAESHGCMRVRNPLKLAEVLLTGQGWNGGRIQGVIEDGAQSDRLPQPENSDPPHLLYRVGGSEWQARDLPRRLRTRSAVAGGYAVLIGTGILFAAGGWASRPPAASRLLRTLNFFPAATADRPYAYKLK